MKIFTVVEYVIAKTKNVHQWGMMIHSLRGILCSLLQRIREFCRYAYGTISKKHCSEREKFEGQHYTYEHVLIYS